MRAAPLLAAALAATGLAFAEEPPVKPEPPRRARIEGVERLQGPDPMLPALARAIRIATDPAVSDDDLYGLTGTAFLATVCSNNCNCRDWRELSLRIDPTLQALGIGFERLTNADEAGWGRVRASIADGVPVVSWNVFGDFEDALVTGYDLDAGRVWGWGVAPAGADYAEAPLGPWKEGGIHGFLVRRGRMASVDRVRLELDALDQAVAAALRPALEGG